MCQCYQIGGPYIAEDPDCEVHGRQAEIAREERAVLIDRLTIVASCGTETEVWQALVAATEYIRSMDH